MYKNQIETMKSNRFKISITIFNNLNKFREYPILISKRKNNKQML